MDKVKAIKDLAVKIVNALMSTSYDTDDFAGDDVVEVLKSVAVKLELAPSTNKIKSDTIVGVLNYITDNYGSDTKEPYDLVVTPTKTTVVVKRNGVTVNPDTDILYEGDVLTITATADSDYALRTLTVNSVPFTSGGTYTVSGNVAILAISKQLVDLSVTDTNSVVIVTERGTTIDPGENALAIGDVINVSAAPALDGYEITTLTINTVDYTAGTAYTVTSSGVAVVAIATEVTP